MHAPLSAAYTATAEPAATATQSAGAAVQSAGAAAGASASKLLLQVQL